MNESTRDEIADIYDVEAWGAGYFEIGPRGNLLIRPRRGDARYADLREIVEHLVTQKQLKSPLLLRFPNRQRMPELRPPQLLLQIQLRSRDGQSRCRGRGRGAVSLARAASRLGRCSSCPRLGASCCSTAPSPERRQAHCPPPSWRASRRRSGPAAHRTHWSCCTTRRFR